LNVGPMGKAMDAALRELERECPGGISSAQLLAFLEEQGIRFSEATLRKWVQLSLLPRSVRVGTKGKHQGSHGLYPVRVVRQIMRIKEMMARDLTIEEIQRQFLFVRGDIEALQQTLDHIFEVLGRVAKERGQGAVSVRALGTDIGRARALANELLERVEDLERRLSEEAPAARAEVVAS
jgi:hypothetical protein